MCTIHNIRLLNYIFAVAKLVMCLYIFGVGVSFSGNVYIHQAFGIAFASMGGGLATLGCMSGLIIPVHLFAVKRHNKFLLVVSFFVDLLVLSLVVVVGLDVKSYTTPLYPKELQAACTLRTTDVTVDECEPFFNDDRTAGFRLVWESLYADRNNTVSFQVLSTIEGRECCGFFAPQNCIPNDAAFPSDRPLDGIPGYQAKDRVVCGNMPTYYPEQRDCYDFYDPAAIPPILGGCNWDMGLGFCITRKIEDDSSGCASQMEDYMISLILPHALMILGSSAFNAISMLIACCMFWKRKEYDVFPEFRLPNVPRNHQYCNVDAPKEIIPVEGLLKLRGFAPPVDIERTASEEGSEEDSDDEEDDEDEEESEQS